MIGLALRTLGTGAVLLGLLAATGLLRQAGS